MDNKTKEIRRLFEELSNMADRQVRVIGVMSELSEGRGAKALKAYMKVEDLLTFDKLKRLDELGALGKTQPGWYEHAMKGLKWGD